MLNLVEGGISYSAQTLLGSGHSCCPFVAEVMAAPTDGVPRVGYRTREGDPKEATPDQGLRIQCPDIFITAELVAGRKWRKKYL